VGRFISPDTIVPDPTDPQDLNRSTYAKNNPMRYTDPTGHYSDVMDLKAGGGALGGGAVCHACMRHLLRGLAVTSAGAAGGYALAEGNKQGQTGPKPVSSDVGGNTASPNPTPPSGFDQEDAVRRILEQEYDQPYGASDDLIRSNLGLSRGSQAADFVGQHRTTGNWLIAESKGNHMGKAIGQLQTTMDALLTQNPAAAGNVQLRIYTNSVQYQRLLQDPRGLAGYQLRNGQLGWFDEAANQWQYAEIHGIRIFVSAAP
jgi:hypothetical protein